MKNFFILSLILFLSCCTISEETYTPSGKKGYSIDCSGDTLSWAGCYSKAGEICGKLGYKTIEKSTDKSSSLGGSQYGLYGAETNSRAMLIECHKSQ